MTHSSPHRTSLRKKRLSHKIKIPLIVLGVLILVALVLHLTLPYFLLRFANQKLSEIPGYRGHISDIDISLLRGAYVAKDVQLEKIDGHMPVPFFSARLVDLSVEWHALFHGKIVTEIYLTDPWLNFVAGPTPDESQTSIDTAWKATVRGLAPFQINHFAIRNGEIHFHNYHSQPKVDLHIDHLEVDMEGLTNSSKPSAVLPAAFHATGTAMDQGKLRLDIRLAPLVVYPTFDLNGELTGLPVKTLNDFLKAYAHVDASGGTLGLFTEMTASDGRFKGYVKPLLKDIKILGPEDKKDNLFHQLWEATVAGVTQIFENPPKEQVGTQIPFSGNFSDPKPEIWTTLGYLVKNAFIQALKPQLNNSIHFGDADPKNKSVVIKEVKKK